MVNIPNPVGINPNQAQTLGKLLVLWWIFIAILFIGIILVRLIRDRGS